MALLCTLMNSGVIIIQIGFSKAVPEFLAELDEILGVMAVLFRVGKLGAASEA